MDETRATARILIVEDNGIIAYTLQGMVAELGYEVVGPVSSGEQAIQKANEKSPDLILMDVNLAGKLSGVEAAAQIQAQSNTLVIYLSGYAEDTLFRDVEPRGPYACLSKPVNKRQLGETIEKMLARFKI
ncbi:MAG: response regulator [Chloroflexi bacterium]|nr:response regulator [Chloroflexota bacterium]